jgi:hypothetical protein
MAENYEGHRKRCQALSNLKLKNKKPLSAGPKGAKDSKLN